MASTRESIQKAVQEWEAAYKDWITLLNEPPDPSQRDGSARWKGACDLLHEVVELCECALRDAVENASTEDRERAYAKAGVEVAAQRTKLAQLQRAAPAPTLAQQAEHNRQETETKQVLRRACSLQLLLKDCQVTRDLLTSCGMVESFV